jgi:hypothetical protein
LRPPKIDWRSTIATPWPGTIASKKVVAKNAGTFNNRDFIQEI